MPETPTSSRRLRFPISVKLALTLVLAALIPLAIATVMLTRQGLRDVESTAQKNLQLVASVTAARIDQLLIDTQRVLAIKTADPDVIRLCSASAGNRPALLPPVDTALAAVKNANPDIASVIVADAAGRGLASTNAANINMDLSFRDYMQHALAGQACLSDLLVGKTTGEPGLYFCGPVLGPEGKIVGAIVIKLDGDTLTNLCGHTSDQLSHGFAAIADRHGIIISHTDPAIRYHCLSELPDEEMRAINPQLRFDIPTIDSLRLDDLGHAVRTATGPGNVAFVDASHQRQVAGYAPTRQRDWIVVAVQPRAEFDRPLRQLANTSIFLAALLAILAALTATLLARRLVRPLHALTRAASAISSGDLSTRADVHTHDEIRDLADTFNAMVPKLKEHTQMEHSLRLAQEVQRNLLPDAAPPIPGLDVAGVNIPAEHAGGDYFDFLDLSTWRAHTLAIAIGDVTGHGIPAALLMASARSLLRARATPPGQLAELFADVNRRLYDDTPPERFMTLMYALIDRPDRRINLVSAGHDPIILFDPAAAAFRELEGADLPLAVEKDWTFTEQIYTDLPANALLVFGTDGIWEARNPSGDLFTKERLLAVIRTHAPKPAAEIVTAITTAVRTFRGPGPQQDDVTIVVVKFI